MYDVVPHCQYVDQNKGSCFRQNRFTNQAGKLRCNTTRIQCNHCFVRKCLEPRKFSKPNAHSWLKFKMKKSYCSGNFITNKCYIVIYNINFKCPCDEKFDNETWLGVQLCAYSLVPVALHKAAAEVSRKANLQEGATGKAKTLLDRTPQLTNWQIVELTKCLIFFP